MQEIQTRYLNPTHSRGARIKATCAAGSITISYPYELSGQAVHRKATEALVDKLDWVHPNYGGLLGGCLPNGDYCFIFNSKLSEE
jgi:hypothetical protein